MTRWRPFVQVDAFTTKPLTGNAAAVVVDADDLDPVIMQRIAREMNVSETAFVLQSTQADWRLRWWTPTVEVPLCGHATVAACHALVEMGRVRVPGTYTIETAAGLLAVELEASDVAPCRVWLDIPIPDWRASNLLPVAIANALQLDEDRLVAELMPMRGGDYMYIAVQSVADVLSLKPDFNALELLSATHDITGWVIFALDGISAESAVHLRFFAPALGIKEDPVTGSAQGPLGALLAGAGLLAPNQADGFRLSYQAEQGDALSRPGRVLVDVTLDAEGVPVRSRIGGVAVTVLRGEFRSGVSDE